MGWLGSGRWVGEECRGPPRRVSSRRRCAAVSRIQASTSRWDTPLAPPALITRAQGPQIAGGCFKARWRCPGVSETSVYSGTLCVFHVMLAPTRRKATFTRRSRAGDAAARRQTSGTPLGDKSDIYHPGAWPPCVREAAVPRNVSGKRFGMLATCYYEILTQAKN